MTKFDQLLALLKARKQNIGYSDDYDDLIEIEADRPPDRTRHYVIFGLSLWENKILWSVEPMEKREGRDATAAAWRPGEERKFRRRFRHLRRQLTPALRKLGLRFTTQVAEIHTLNPM